MRPLFSGIKQIGREPWSYNLCYYTVISLLGKFCGKFHLPQRNENTDPYSPHKGLGQTVGGIFINKNIKLEVSPTFIANGTDKPTVVYS